MRFLLTFFIPILFFSGCSTLQNRETPGSKLKRYNLTGKVVSVNKAKGEAAIAHDEIPGYMSAMTMDFPIRDKEILNDLTPGAEISGVLVVDNPNGTYWLEVKGMVAKPTSDQNPLPVKEGVATLDKKIIDFTLINEERNKISPADFRGKVWALTFIYAQCPLPNFCILMSKNFSDAANKIADNPALKDKMRLLSISFDPGRDTPEKLKEYKKGYLGKDSKALETDIWQVAVGEDKKVRKIADFFGLDYKVNNNDKTQFDHSLRTIVINEKGVIKKIILGNEWKSEDLLKEMKKAMKE